jgi:hypothetical protein
MKGRGLLRAVLWRRTGGPCAKLANGRKVFNRKDAVVWLIEQLEERVKPGRNGRGHGAHAQDATIYFQPSRVLPFLR